MAEPGQRNRIARTRHGIRRVWPFVMMAWERWQRLSPAEKERYKRQARDYAERGRRAFESRRGPRR